MAPCDARYGVTARAVLPEAAHARARAGAAAHALVQDNLDVATTVRLLSSYGRQEDLVYYAALRGDHAAVIAAHLRANEPLKALAVLRRPSLPVALHYQFAPTLMAKVPKETVDAWLAAGAALDPRRLIPALTRCSQKGGTAAGRAEAVRFLEHAVHATPAPDPALRNLLLALYAQGTDETALLRFVQDAAAATGAEAARYDLKYALRVCLTTGHPRACVHLYCALGMFDEAVALALQVDLPLAKAVAEKPEDDPVLRRKLWLRIARHVVAAAKEGRLPLPPPPATAEGGEDAPPPAAGPEVANMQAALAFLGETNSVLKMEDILPFFPDFVLVDHFKAAICASLEEYNTQIEELKKEMASATLSADNIRRDIGRLSQRHAVVESTAPCCVCQRLVLKAPGAELAGLAPLGSPLYFFPCSHAFHSSCLASDLKQKLGPVQRAQIDTIQRQIADEVAKLSKAKGAGKQDPPGGGKEEEGGGINEESALDTLRQQLDNVVGAECPLCGDMMIRSITDPFILPEEEELAKSWAITA